MKSKVKKIMMCLVALTGLASGESFAADFQDLPFEMVKEIYSYIEPKDLRTARFDRLTRAVIEEVDPNTFKKRLERIEKILELDYFIPLTNGTLSLWQKNQNQAISHVGISQALWFEVMGDNPSHFKEEKYCPETHKILDGVEMCPELPVEMVGDWDINSRDSDVEFLNRLNQTFEVAGKARKFRRATAEEYFWADTEGGTQYMCGNRIKINLTMAWKAKAPKSENDSNFWLYTTYRDISDKGPRDLSQLSPSGKPQTHGVKAKLPNKFGFYRNSVAEWTETMKGAVRVLVGSSWNDAGRDAVSGIQRTVLESESGFSAGPFSRLGTIGPARLVMTTQ